MQPKKHKRYRRKEKPAPRYLNAPEDKPLTEVMIQKDYDYAHHDDIYYDDWVTKTLREQHHLRRRGGPLVVSLCAFKGLSATRNFWEKAPKSHPNHPSNPYQAISICLGGSHVLSYCYDDWCVRDFPVKPLMHLLEDKKVVVIGVGIKEIAKKLLDQWQLQITHPVDLRKVVASVYGKEAVWWPKHERGHVVIDSRGLEEMAELVLEGMRLEKKPARVLEADWGDSHSDALEMELIKYASRDAFLSYEIATKCTRKAGGLPSETESGS